MKIASEVMKADWQCLRLQRLPSAFLNIGKSTTNPRTFSQAVIASEGLSSPVSS